MRTYGVWMAASALAAVLITSGAARAEPPEQLIRIRLQSRTLELFENGKRVCFPRGKKKRPICRFPVRVGAPETPTPVGEGVVYVKRRRPVFRYLDGPDKGNIRYEADCPSGDKQIDYPRMRSLGIFINGRKDISVHSLTGGETVGLATSHGCVGMKISHMLLLYPRVRVGATVIITDD